MVVIVLPQGECSPWGEVDREKHEKNNSIDTKYIDIF